MKLIVIIKYSINNLKRRQLRSWLTILGVVIGIAAVVSLLTIGQGFNDEIQKQLGELGTNTIFVAPMTEEQTTSAAFSSSPGFVTSGKLFERDAERLKRIPEIEEITKINLGQATVEFKGKQITALVEGIEPGIFEKTTLINVEEGRFLLPNDQRVAVMGSSLAEDGFGNNKVGVNSFIIMNGKKFRVIGILEKSGGGFGASSEVDTIILVQFEDAQELFKESLAENEVGYIVVTVREGADIPAVTDKITLEIAASHKIRPEDKDFSVISPQMIQEQISSVLGLVTGFLAAIASISLIVGGVGISNIMFTSVIERTREIGILKAVGATRKDILNIFIVESAVIGGAGGLIGIVIGLSLVYLLGFFGVPISVGFEIPLFALVFSIVVGLLSGFIPARNASRLSPVDALRFE